MKVIVSKFGGSSVKDAAAMRRCAEIVKSNESIGVVILSATHNTTNQLERMAHLAMDKKCDESIELLYAIKERHYQIAKELDADNCAYKLIDEILLEGESLIRGIYLLKEISDRAMDRLYSIGERMSSALFAGVLKNYLGREVVLVDARRIIKTNSDFNNAIPILSKIKERVGEYIVPHLKKNTVVVTQGFIGSNIEGATTTLGREGSDFSAALVAEALEAKEIQIWTDVAGIFSTDPRITADAFKFDQLQYDEASNMAHLGAKVLYPETLAPASRKDIPVYVGSSINPELDGTWIRSDIGTLPVLRAVAKTDDHILMTVTDNVGRPHRRFHKVLLDVLDRNNISYESFFGTTGGATILFAEKYQLSSDLIADIEREFSIVDQALVSRVSIIGNDLEREAGIISKIMSHLNEGGTNIFRFNGGSRFLSFYVSTDSAEDLLKKLHFIVISN